LFNIHALEDELELAQVVETQAKTLQTWSENERTGSYINSISWTEEEKCT